MFFRNFIALTRPNANDNSEIVLCCKLKRRFFELEYADNALRCSYEQVHIYCSDRSPAMKNRVMHTDW